MSDVGRLFQPTYLVVVNKPQDFADDRFDYVRSSECQALFTHLDLPVDHPAQVRFRLDTFAGCGLPREGALHYTQNSPYVACCLAAHMGATWIGLVGVDFTDHHFFGETGPHKLTARPAEIDAQYAGLSRALANRGVELVNLSARSQLRSLRKVVLPPPVEPKPEPEREGLVVSVLMLVRDEAATLERAIRSVEGLADEVVVGVDTRTVDDSQAVAMRCGARTVPITFSGDFAVAHNQLDAHARGTWGFKLDGHEFLEAGHAQRLRTLLEHGASGCGAVACQLRTDEVDGGVRAIVLRAYRRGADTRYEGCVHEQVTGWGGRAHGAPEIVIRHARAPVRAEARAQQRRTSDRTQLEARVQAMPDDSASWLALALLQWDARELRAARSSARRAWATSTDAKAALRCEVAVLRARCALALGHPILAGDRAREAVQLRWDVPEAYCVLAEAARARGAPRAEIESWVRVALTMPRAAWEYPVQVRHHTWWPCRFLGQLAEEAGETAVAAGWYERAMGYELPQTVEAELRDAVERPRGVPTRRRPDRTVLFHHVPKTGGASLLHALTRGLDLQTGRLGTARRAQFIDWVEDGRRWVDGHPEARLFSSHYALTDVEPRADELLITWIRDPLAMLFSAWRYYRQPGLPDAVYRPVEVREELLRLRAAPRIEAYLDDVLDRRPRRGIPFGQLSQLGDAFEFVGALENHTTSLARLGELLGVELPVVRVNTTTRPDESLLTDHRRAEVLELLEPEYAAYNRLAARHGHPTLRP